MWTAEVISKQIADGLLKVTVQFTDGTTTFTDRYETRSGQDANWLKSNIQRRLNDLETLNQFAETIPIGNVDLEIESEVTIIEENSEYKLKLDEFGRYVEAIRKGIIAEDNTDFIACQKWLKDNFSPDVINLF